MSDRDGGPGGGGRRGSARGHRPSRFRAGGVWLKMFADTDHSGTVEESDREWDLRQTSPGAILVFNCDRDGATSPALDFTDDLLVNDDELSDFAKLVIKQNASLPAGHDSFLTMTSADAPSVRIFDRFAAGATAVMGKVGAATVTEYPLTDIRTRDYVFAIEAMRPVKVAGDDKVKVSVVIKKAGAEKFNDYVLFTIAPWLMLSNLEEVQTAYVAKMESLSASTTFISALRGILGGRLQVLSPPDTIEQWLQDIFEVGFSSQPATRSRPMHQVINSVNADSRSTRANLWNAYKSSAIGRDYGLVSFSMGVPGDFNSYGNLEVTPPSASYPFGRVYFGKVDSSFSTGHPGESLDSSIQDFLQANNYQPHFMIPTNWLTVGHVDEFLSFVPNLNSGAPKKYKLLVASPREAISLCQKLKDAGQGSAIISKDRFTSSSTRYDLEVNAFLSNTGDLRRVNESVDRIIRTIITSISSEFDVASDDIIEIPVIFSGDYEGPTKVRNAIARTGGMVNCLVARPHIIVPKPFGPKDRSGKDVFEEAAKNKLGALGLTVHFVDDWELYHNLSGEIHCGTNARRRPPGAWRWWDRSLQIGGSSVHS